MDLTSLFTLTGIVAGLAFSFFLLLRSIKVEVQGRKILLPQLVGGLCLLICCCAITIFYLPKTQYGSYVLGKYHFSKFMKSGAEDEANKSFYIWQKSANKNAFAVALETIPENSTVWKSFIRRSSSLYHDRDNPDKYFEYLESLRQKLTKPLGKSAIHLLMGNAYMALSPDTSIEFFNEVISLNVDPLDTEMAEGNIHEIQYLNPGQKAPDFVFTSLDDFKFSPDNLSGKVVLLDFWSMNCHSCIKELPTLKKIYSTFKKEDFVLLNISLKHGKETTDFITGQQLPGHHILINRDNSTELLKKFNIQYIPTTYILDKEGKIAFKKVRGKQLEDALNHLLLQN